MGDSISYNMNKNIFQPILMFFPKWLLKKNGKKLPILKNGVKGLKNVICRRWETFFFIFHLLWMVFFALISSPSELSVVCLVFYITHRFPERKGQSEITQYRILWKIIFHPILIVFFFHLIFLNESFHADVNEYSLSLNMSHSFQDKWGQSGCTTYVST